MKIDLSATISLIISFFAVCTSFVLGYATFKRNKTTDDKSEASDMTTVIVKLETINDGVREIKNDMRAIQNDVKAQSETIIRLDESVKSAWKRISFLESRRTLNNEEDTLIVKKFIQ